MKESTLGRVLREQKDGGLKGLIPYVTAGDPDVALTRDVLVALSEAGATAIEVGIPFSDPIADGPVIQEASQRALEGGASLDAILRMLEDARAEIRCPLIIFSYVNPIDRMGYDVFVERATRAGASALLVTDAPPGVEPALETALRNGGMDLIVLVAPTTPEERLPLIASAASGFVYVIARRGVTGKGGESTDLAGQLGRLRKHTELPLYVGFGVRERADVVRLSEHADGVIVGSALVTALHETPRAQRAQRAGDFLRDLLG